jgi:D-tyrosyl-tRNA(Tyr) deacylase
MRKCFYARQGLSRAAKPEDGLLLYEHFANEIAAAGVLVAKGVFGADMHVALVNSGPVTIWLDTDS